LLKKCGLKHIQARISDMVQIYEPEDESKDDMNKKFRYVYENEETYQQGVPYFTARGVTYQRAVDYMDYFQRTREYFELKSSIAVKTSGIYFVYGYN